MLVVAKKLSDNTKQAKLANWGVLSERLRSDYFQMRNFEMIEVIVTGRNDFDALRAHEKLAFFDFLENLCRANEARGSWQEASLAQMMGWSRFLIGLYAGI